MKFKGKKITISKNWLLWLLFVILWNFGYPKASPLEDVVVAVLLSFIFLRMPGGVSGFIHLHPSGNVKDIYGHVLSGWSYDMYI